MYMFSKVGARSTDPAILREFEKLLDEGCSRHAVPVFSAPGDDVTFFTLTLGVKKDLSLRSLVDCG